MGLLMSPVVGGSGGGGGGGGGISGTISAGQVAYASTTDTIAGSNTLQYDSATGYFGRVSSGSPEAPLHVKGPGSEMLRLQTTTTFPVYIGFKSGTANDLARVVGVSASSNGGELSFYTKDADSNSASSSTERGRIDSNGNFWIGTSHTITSGVYSIIGGRNNTIASGGNPCAMFGEYNSVSYAWAFAAGYGNTVTHQSSIALGQSNTINDSSRAAVALGEGNTISSSSRGIAAGNSNSVTGGASFAVGISNSVSNTRAGALGYSMSVTASDSIGINVGTNSATLSESNTFGVFGGQELLKSHINFPGSGMYRETAAVTTSDDAVTTLWSKTLNDATVYRMYVGIVARRSDSGTENGIFERVFKVYRQGAGAVLGTVTTPWADDQTTMAGLITVDVSSNDIRVRVTGEAAKTFQWAAEIKYQPISTSS